MLEVLCTWLAMSTIFMIVAICLGNIGQDIARRWDWIKRNW